MFITRYSKFILAFLLMAFTSQILASATITCNHPKAEMFDSTANVERHTRDHTDHQMSEMSPPITKATNYSLMDHTSHTNESQRDHQQSSCCETLGQCLMGNCSLAATDALPILFIIEPFTSKVDYYPSATSSPHIPSPYRPPILG